MWIDAHCHLSDPRFTSIDEELKKAQSLGIQGWVLGGYDAPDWDRQKAIESRWPGSVKTSFGLHPWWVSQSDETSLDKALKTLEARLPEAAALGELGLDGLRENESLQRKAFQAQLEIAKVCPKPLVLHVVKSHSEALSILDHVGIPPTGGLVHAFSSDLKTAQAYLDRGFLISVGSGVLKRGYQALKATVKSLSLQQMVIETDAPDGTGRLEGLLMVAEAVASLQDGSAQGVLNASAQNLRRLFDWK